MNSDNNRFTKAGVVYPLALLCGFLWGSAFPAIKVGYKLFGIASDDTYTVILFAGIRFFIAGLLTLIAGSVLSKRVLRPKNMISIKYILILALVQTVIQYVFFYIGLANTTGVKSAIISASSVFFCLIISGAIFKMEKVTPLKIIGCVIGFAGVVLINVFGSTVDGRVKIDGEGFIFVSAIAYAMSSVLIGKFSEREEPAVLSGYQFMLGGFAMIIFGLIEGGRIECVSLKALLLLVYLGFVSAAAYTIWSVLLKFNPVSRITVFGFVNPVVGVILSGVILKEADQLSPGISLLSLLLVSIGIVCVNLKKREE